jgi:hypothetical protein
LIYQDLNHSRIWSQCNNEPTRLYEFATGWLKDHGGVGFKYQKLYWNRRIMATHHEAIDEFVCPSKCFGALYWEIVNSTTGDPPQGLNQTCMEACLEDAVTLEDVEACIDLCLFPGGTGSGDDPSPAGWEDEGPFRRSRLRLYFFILGWSCFWLPWFYVSYAKGLEKIMSFWVAVMISIIGLALLWALPGI